MLNRATWIRSNLLIVALGALLFSAVSILAADSAVKVATITPSRKPVPRKPVVSPIQKSQDSAKPVVRTPADGSWGQINAANVNVRTGPSTQNPILVTLHGGDFIKPTAQVGNWMEIEWPENLPTWVAKNVVRMKADMTAVAKAETLVYAQGHRQSAVVARISANTALMVTGETADWYKIVPPKTAKAYINAKYVLTGVHRPVTSTDALAQETSSTRADAVMASVQRHYESPSPIYAATMTSKKEDTVPSALPLADMSAKLTNQIEETRKLLTATISDSKISEKQEPVIADITPPVETARSSAEVKPQPDNVESVKLMEEKNLEQIEIARAIEQSKHKVEENATQVRCENLEESVATAPKNATSALVFLPPDELVAKIEAPVSPKSVVAVSLPEPASPVSTAKIAEKSHLKAPIILEDNLSSANANATPEPLRDAEQKVRIRFVLPSDQPCLPGARAEVIDPLPIPTDPAPVSHRLHPQHKAQVCNMETGNLISAEGIIENIAASSVNGVTYALVCDGQTLHWLNAREHLGLENFVGRRVMVTGTKLQSVSANDSVLEVGSISAKD
ncbi:MAG: hypothetical protein V1899_07645 [Planctomycetota bacterium]